MRLRRKHWWRRWPAVVRYCRARLGRLDGGYTTADDVSQEVCLAVLRALPTYRDMGRPFSAFVYTIAAHKVADAQRAAGRSPAAMPIEALPQRPDNAPGPEQRAINADLVRRLSYLLGHLSDTHREIIVLRVAVGRRARPLHRSRRLRQRRVAQRPSWPTGESYHPNRAGHVGYAGIVETALRAN
jgi:RNA polymerase sigma factor (sigma-70 family)